MRSLRPESGGRRRKPRYCLDAPGLPFRDYDEKEKFLLEVAREAGLNGWQLDRLIYKSKDALRRFERRAPHITLRLQG